MKSKISVLLLSMQKTKFCFTNAKYIFWFYKLLLKESINCSKILFGGTGMDGMVTENNIGATRAIDPHSGDFYFNY